MSNEMPDSTKDLLNNHHAAILRELDGLGRDMRSGLTGLESDIANTRAVMQAHAVDDNTRFSTIDNSLSVLKWAYGVAAIVFMALLAKLEWFK